MSAPQSPLELFYQWEKETPNRIYLRQPKNLQWREYTWAEVADQVRRIAAFLINKHYPPASRIAIWSSNSKDWPICDLAIMLAGHISVPIYPGQDCQSANYILRHSETKLIFCGAFDQSAKVKDALVEGVETVAMLGCGFEFDTSLEEIVAIHQPFRDSPIPEPDDVFTTIYTSGTTGNPKGVMHMHKTPGLVVPRMLKVLKMDHDENRLFSFLPMSHAAERIVVEMMSLYTNSPVSFSEGLETFADELRSVQPTVFFAVPRLWMKFKEGIDAKIPPASQPYLTEDQKAEIIQHLGLGKARTVLTGSASCPDEVHEWYLNLGIVLREGYAMTETFAHGCSWHHNDTPLLGSVGIPNDDSVQVRITDAGEIQFKTPGLMKGYYLEPDETAEVIEDGWYNTGDSGKMDDNGNLWLTGRISEVFKTSKGKFIQPARLENLFARCHLLAQFCVIGHGFDQPVLLTTLSEAGVNTSEEVLRHELEDLLNQVNSETAAHEKVANTIVVPEWTIENGGLTPTLKIKRRQIEERYRCAIKESLAGPAGGRVLFLT
ncbi:AMP-binding protein [Pseudomaricurvus alkylphenolicus]|uniref:AMP-binding protein n=1 Tax=Pseudomaricurvus alkylphenolicus TaxID=1306991 RepID=UPI001422DC1A|nr:AMP-binding protein [Pseudomaricurvus alkylphenolicus]NIB38170.1 AMP-binding protein [Pseudomaricurvus alkylphenolicus]